jgi:V/A-type H+/Na+-transporting ATPase subunit K
MEFWGMFALALPILGGAIGSALGISAAGQAAAGAWAREGKEGKQPSFTYIIMVAAPLSQTIYGAMLMLIGLRSPVYAAGAAAMNAGALVSIALAGGVAELASAWMQGRIGAGFIRALLDNEGQGLAFMIIALGIVETVGLFAFVFLLMVLPVLK